MKKQTHIEALEGEMTAAQTELDACQSVLRQRQETVEQTVMSGKSDQEIDVLQQERDAVARQVERCGLRIQGLDKRKPEATKADAEQALPGLVKAVNERVTRLETAYAGLSAAWGAVLNAVAACEKVQAEAGTILEDHAKIRLLAMENGLTVPEVPVLPIFSQDVVRQAHYEQARAIAYWQPTRGTWTKRAKEQQALNEQRAVFEREKTQRQAA